MDSDSEQILHNRRAAAEFSRGISCDTIYAAIHQLLIERDLGGEVLDYGAGTGQLTRGLLASQRFKRVRL